MKMLTIATTAAIMLLVACDDGPTAPPTDPWTPTGEAYEPPALYETWWAEVGECLCMTADFGSVNWFRVPGWSFETPDYGTASGRWVEPHDIYIAEYHVGTRTIVKHEMVHDYLQGGAADDPRFLECSGLAHKLEAS